MPTRQVLISIKKSRCTAVVVAVKRRQYVVMAVDGEGVIRGEDCTAEGEIELTVFVQERRRAALIRSAR